MFKKKKKNENKTNNTKSCLNLINRRLTIIGGGAWVLILILIQLCNSLSVQCVIYATCHLVLSLQEEEEKEIFR